MTLRVIALGELPPEETPYRVRVTLPAASAKVSTGEAVSLKATLRPPPEPIIPNGFDFGRTAWFDRLGATGYGTGTIEALADVGEAPLACGSGPRSTVSALWSTPASEHLFPASGSKSQRH
jgi:competence protein ComEC